MSILQILLKPSKIQRFSLITMVIALTGTTVFYHLYQFELTDKVLAKLQIALIGKKITASGRLQPKKEVVRVSAPLKLDKDRVAVLLVQKGDFVKAGQAIAILDSRERLQSSLLYAQKQLSVAQAKLAQVKAGAKGGEINAQTAKIRRLEAQWQYDKKVQATVVSRLETQLQADRETQQATIKKLAAEFNNAQAEYQRYQQLYAQGVISASIFDSKRLYLETSHQQLNEARISLARVESTNQKQLNEAKISLIRIENTGQEQLNEAKATLDQIAEVRVVDVQTAQAEVDVARAAVKQAETDLEQVYVQAAITGQILEIYTREGESISDSGIADLGQIN